jgi:hypothetical protein
MSQDLYARLSNQLLDRWRDHGYHFDESAVIASDHMLCPLWSKHAMEESTKLLLSAGSGGLAGAVLTLVGQGFMRWYSRPRLVLVPYEHRPPMYRLAPDGQTGKKAFWVNVGVRNRGRSVAEKCRAVITAKAELKQDIWVQDKNWLPLDLRWGHGYPEPERDLIPEPMRKVQQWGTPIVYYFSIAYIADDGTNQLHLAVTRRPTAQPTSLPPGIYSVQIIVYSANGEWSGRWYEIILRGGTSSFSDDCLTVRELPAAPVANS